MLLVKVLVPMRKRRKLTAENKCSTVTTDHFISEQRYLKTTMYVYILIYGAYVRIPVMSNWNAGRTTMRLAFNSAVGVGMSQRS